MRTEIEAYVPAQHSLHDSFGHPITVDNAASGGLLFVGAEENSLIVRKTPDFIGTHTLFGVRWHGNFVIVMACALSSRAVLLTVVTISMPFHVWVGRLMGRWSRRPLCGGCRPLCGGRKRASGYQVIVGRGGCRHDNVLRLWHRNGRW